MPSNDTLYGIMLILVVLGSLVSVGTYAARRKVFHDESHAPEVRRRIPVRSALLRPDAVAPSSLSRTVARMVRTAEHARTALARGAAGVRPGANVQSTPDNDLPHSQTELYQLTQIILHKQRGRSKADAIRDVTGISKGGNQKYQRWARMVDLATEPPSRFRQYTEEEKTYLAAPAPNGHGHE